MDYTNLQFQRDESAGYDKDKSVHITVRPCFGCICFKSFFAYWVCFTILNLKTLLYYHTAMGKLEWCTKQSLCQFWFIRLDPFQFINNKMAYNVISFRWRQHKNKFIVNIPSSHHYYWSSDKLHQLSFHCGGLMLTKVQQPSENNDVIYIHLDILWSPLLTSTASSMKNSQIPTQNISIPFDYWRTFCKSSAGFILEMCICDMDQMLTWILYINHIITGQKRHKQYQEWKGSREVSQTVLHSRFLSCFTFKKIMTI